VAITEFKDSSYQLSTLLDEIRRGEIGLPDIQRPFVWNSSKVRELVDSMYKGFPVGFLLFWATGAEAGARRIGTDDSEAAPRLMIIDGQQRLTGLYSVITGKPIVWEDYTEGRIRISFRPRDQVFAVTDAAIEKNPEYVTDISTLWIDGGKRRVTRAFMERLQESKGEISDQEQDRLEDAIDRLFNLQNYPFKVLELNAELDEEQVADVFVRINSKGVSLDQADFILTLMSVWWDQGRKKLETFARLAKKPIPNQASPSNPFIDPSPDQMIRVAAGLAFNRGRLRYVYQVLRGRNLKTGDVEPEARDKQFQRLQEAVSISLDLTNWHEFFKAVRRAGYRSRAMKTSDNNLLFAYLMYLIGLRDHSIDRIKLREVIARWFFMTALTGRYTGSFESRVESDLQRVATVESGEEFISLLDKIIDTELTNDYWKITLPNALDTSAAYSPTLFAYHASLVLLNAKAMFSNLTIAELMDPHTHAPRAAVERHHLFPKKYLENLGYTNVYNYNQIANFAFLEWPDNAAIGATAPAEYFPQLFARLSPTEQRQASFWHALPEGWETMDYEDFIVHRRLLISEVIQAAFHQLRTGEVPEIEMEESVFIRPSRPSIDELLRSEESAAVEFKSSAYYSYKPDVPERVINESVIKTVAGFLNAEGGLLGVGINDNREVVGINADLEFKNMDTDRYVNALTTMLERSLGASVASAVKIEIEAVNGEQVCIFQVPASREPVYANTSKGPNGFYVRTNNSTRVLDGPDMYGYIRRRFPDS